MRITTSFDVELTDGLLPETTIQAMLKVINIVASVDGTNFNVTMDQNIPLWMMLVAKRVVKELVIARLRRDDYMLDNQIAACEQHVITIIKECQSQSATPA